MKLMLIIDIKCESYKILLYKIQYMKDQAEQIESCLVTYISIQESAFTAHFWIGSYIG